MAPLLEHDNDGEFLGFLVVTLTQERGLSLKAGGSATMRRRKKRRGLEADKCYWIASAALMGGRRRLDLRKDPPPDLAIEVDVTNSSLDRMGIYAALRVPEVWRLEGDDLSFHVLDESGAYQPAAYSRSFPGITAADLMVFLQQARQSGDDNAVIRDFRAWLGRQRGAAGS